jgi:hypothetical protein
MIMGCYGTPEEAYHEHIEKDSDGFQYSEVDMHSLTSLGLDSLQRTPHISGAKQLIGLSLVYHTEHKSSIKLRLEHLYKDIP